MYAPVTVPLTRALPMDRDARWPPPRDGRDPRDPRGWSREEQRGGGGAGGERRDERWGGEVWRGGALRYEDDSSCVLVPGWWQGAAPAEFTLVMSFVAPTTTPQGPYTLWEAGADPRAIDQDKSTVLHDAAAGGCLAAVSRLLELAPELVSARDEDEETPLHCAARGGYSAVVSALLAAGAPRDVLNVAGQTAAACVDEVDADTARLLA